jgi:hypothetical protein
MPPQLVEHYKNKEAKKTLKAFFEYNKKQKIRNNGLNRFINHV